MPFTAALSNRSFVWPGHDKSLGVVKAAADRSGNDAHLSRGGLGWWISTSANCFGGVEQFKSVPEKVLADESGEHAYTARKNKKEIMCKRVMPRHLGLRKFSSMLGGERQQTTFYGWDIATCQCVGLFADGLGYRGCIWPSCAHTTWVISRWSEGEPQRFCLPLQPGIWWFQVCRILICFGMWDPMFWCYLDLFLTIWVWCGDCPAACCRSCCWGWRRPSEHGRRCRWGGRLPPATFAQPEQRSSARPRTRELQYVVLLAGAVGLSFSW